MDLKRGMLRFAMIVVAFPRFCIEGGAILQIKLMTFRVDNERDSDGLCCEWSCTGQCDPVFHFCADDFDGPRDFSKCPYLSTRTNSYDESNVVNFGKDLHGTPNPMSIRIPSWKGGAMFKISVDDDDGMYSSNDDIDTFFFTFQMSPYLCQKSALWSQRTLSGERMDTNPTQVRVYCEEFYFGDNCTDYCQGTNSSEGHYTCDPRNGRKVCLPGWANVSSACTDMCDSPLCQKKGACVDMPCQNGGLCEPKGPAYQCFCLPGWTGSDCESQMTDAGDEQVFSDFNTASIDVPYTPEGVPLWIVAMVVVLVVAVIIFISVYVIVRKQSSNSKPKTSGTQNPVYEEATDY
ncbi:hypothetical protein CAPTEDRAFT_202432 [Capitella teleta]|uniref:Delta-like protein n=1 Tax=Capitella teleta TaxID=283909 RepID=R7TZP1_CAPTE|nr:hypothetical protein CAPTEDRAFT_202432 [Capitella teleta]|eukprot:ELT99229.1 hypothetical protein CAPTEDRAFT_202432 [Capitella teleta]